MGAVCCLGWKRTFVAWEEGVQAGRLQSEGITAPAETRSWGHVGAWKGNCLLSGGPRAPASCR